MNPVEIGRLLDQGRLNNYLRMLIALTALMIIFDGADLQLLGISIPAMMKEWALPRSAFAPVLAVGMVGMMLGGAIAGFAGDRFGRKLSLIVSVNVFALTTLATAASPNLATLGLLRFLAGLGLGGALPNAAALVAEYAPSRHRPLTVTLTIICVPLGGMLGAYVAGAILPAYGWRTLFVLGGALPLASSFILMLALTESPRFLARHPGRWPELARFFSRAGQAVPEGSSFIDASESQIKRAPIAALFSPEFRNDTTALWCAFFFCLLAVYACFNWIPTLLTGSGFPPAVGSQGLFYFNLGGVFGALAGGIVISRSGSRSAMLTMAGGATIGAGVMAVMPISNGNLYFPIIMMLTLTGALINGVQTTMYALAAHVYPSSVRATGVGTALAIGRSGGVLSTYAGAWALEGGSKAYFAMIAATMVIVFAALFVMKRHVRAPEAGE